MFACLICTVIDLLKMVSLATEIEIIPRSLMTGKFFTHLWYRYNKHITEILIDCLVCLLLHHFAVIHCLFILVHLFVVTKTGLFWDLALVRRGPPSSPSVDVTYLTAWFVPPAIASAMACKCARSTLFAILFNFIENFKKFWTDFLVLQNCNFSKNLEFWKRRNLIWLIFESLNFMPFLMIPSQNNAFFPIRSRYTSTFQTVDEIHRYLSP